MKVRLISKQRSRRVHSMRRRGRPLVLPNCEHAPTAYGVGVGSGRGCVRADEALLRRAALRARCATADCHLYTAGLPSVLDRSSGTKQRVEKTALC